MRPRRRRPRRPPPPRRRPLTGPRRDDPAAASSAASAAAPSQPRPAPAPAPAQTAAPFAATPQAGRSSGAGCPAPAPAPGPPSAPAGPRALAQPAGQARAAGGQPIGAGRRRTHRDTASSQPWNVSTAQPPQAAPAGAAQAPSTSNPQLPSRDICPLCGGPLHSEQEWCLRCGAAARTRLAAAPNWRGPAIALAVIVAISLGVLAASLVKLAGGSGSSTTVTTAAAVIAPGHHGRGRDHLLHGRRREHLEHHRRCDHHADHSHDARDATTLTSRTRSTAPSPPGAGRHRAGQGTGAETEGADRTGDSRKAGRLGQVSPPRRAGVAPRGYTVPQMAELFPAVSVEADVAVVGAGAAGLYAALCAAREHASVVLVSATPLAQTASYWAQGGLAAALAEDDSYELHLRDTEAAGRTMVRRSAAEVLVREAPECVRDLQGLGRALRRRPLRAAGARARGRALGPPRGARRGQRHGPARRAPALGTRGRGADDLGPGGSSRTGALERAGGLPGPGLRGRPGDRGAGGDHRHRRGGGAVVADDQPARVPGRRACCSPTARAPRSPTSS